MKGGSELQILRKGEKKCESASSEETVRIASFKIRWLVLAVATFFLVAVGYNRACFGVVDNVYSRFFNVTREQVDWLTLSMSAVSVFASLAILLMLSYFDFNFHMICLVTAFCITVAYACHLASALSRSLFAVSLLGQISMGLANALAITMVPLVGALWFPKEEVATAVGVCLGGIDVGNIIGFNVPAYFLNNQNKLLESEWTEFVRSHLLVIFLVCFTLSCGVLFIVLLVIKDSPQLPPSLSEAVKLRLSIVDNLKMQSSLSRAFYYLRLVCHDRTFLTLVLCFGLVETCYMLEVLMMSDILRETHAELRNSTDSNVLASHILTLYATGGLIGGVVSGVVLDKTKRFKSVAVASGFSMAIFSAGFLASIATKNMVGCFVTNALYGFFNGACYTALYEIIAQHMYPCKELALGAWITFFVSLVGLLVPLLGRFIYNTVASMGVLILQSVVLLVATLIISCLKPRYERYSVNRSEREVPSVTTPLVKHVESSR